MLVAVDPLDEVADVVMATIDAGFIDELVGLSGAPKPDAPAPLRK